ncbi:MAG: hypothetical protein P4L73_13355 [Caulobacteraceae bacterium]|nr:hypothetical protein [Caulobacteraceae bacterium]
MTKLRQVACALALGCLLAPAAAVAWPTWTDNSGNTHDATGTALASRTPVAGQQVLVLTSTPASLTVPIGATSIDIFPEGTNGVGGQCLRYRDDGLAPNQTSGSGLAAQQDVTGYRANLSAIQFVLASGATCTVTVNYYK